MLVYDEDMYRSLYELYTPSGIIYYSREFLYRSGHWKNQLAALDPLIDRHQSDTPLRIAIAGCGFSPLLDHLGMEQLVFGIDPSPYIQRNKAHHVDNRKILPFAIPDKRIPNFDVLIVDDVLPGLEDSEIQPFLDGCDDIAPSVIQFVTPYESHPLFNSKSILEWAELAPGHKWLDNVNCRRVPERVT